MPVRPGRQPARPGQSAARTGKKARHVRLASPEDLHRPGVIRLLQAAREAASRENQAAGEQSI